jgi:2,3-bisphosphoglycerate-independent phosphoglycerate mutase
MKPVVLCILDGWGLREEADFNAPKLAHTPNFDRIMQGPSAQLLTHGNDAGLPTGQMGNSEVGHTNIGAGRVVAMDLGQIDLAIEDGSFFENAQLQTFISTLQQSGGTAHLMGVVSDGGVHGHLLHIAAAAKAVCDAGVPCVVHAITDGRDVAPKSADHFMAELAAALPQQARIVSVTGRYFAMDRDNRWERVSTAYNAMIRAKGNAAQAADDVVQAGYAQDITDEFLPASVLDGYEGAKDGDGFFCLNFRADRAREIMAAIACTRVRWL